jgi:hypothetical protein
MSINTQNKIRINTQKLLVKLLTTSNLREPYRGFIRDKQRVYRRFIDD